MYVFFFQAEDGIRYLIVTGVQTCALPIYAAQGTACQEREELRGISPREIAEPGRAPAPGIDGFEGQQPPQPDQRHEPARHDDQRSEERRVGKECRSGWTQ